MLVEDIERANFLWSNFDIVFLFFFFEIVHRSVIDLSRCSVFFPSKFVQIG